ncbi:hypothetical protein GPECTOR_15g303 [Gonium pectorale]|uniref:Uncharacterized protein n=1 Tax=Gonium pectorale TaxID=33097 RepID=A0A150GMP8_GONPE|nr:hypothetical protein GPECTOR_15g303 [Gonium pectorale]|eukprot:KXZ50620.1 hypothetical protein GPECTOR_15g303 [Gonium pectorale]
MDAVQVKLVGTIDKPGAPKAPPVTHAPAGRVRPPPRAPSLASQASAFIISPLFQCAMQLTLGTIIICLFVFVRPMRFVQSCLAATLYVVASLLVSQDNHVGTKLLGCAMLCGSVLWGAVLAGCVVSLVKDTVLWSRGILATPPIVPAVLRASLTLTDRLAALGLAASCPPSVGGSFSGWAFEHVTVPLHADTMAIFAALDDMAAATANRLVLMAGGTAAAATACAAEGPAAAAAAAAHGVCGSAEAINAAVAELNQRRLRIRNHVLALRRTFHAAVMTAREEDLPHLTAPDDALRVFSFVFVLIQVGDRATALARTVAAAPDPGRRSWLGGSMWEWCK